MIDGRKIEKLSIFIGRLVFVCWLIFIYSIVTFCGMILFNDAVFKVWPQFNLHMNITVSSVMATVLLELFYSVMTGRISFKPN